MEYPNKIYVSEYTGKNTFDRMSHFVVVTAASSSDVAKAYVKEKLGLDVEPVRLMNAVHHTILVRDGSVPEEVQARILYNGSYNHYK